MRFAIIHNPRSRRNLRDAHAFEAEARRRLGADFVTVSEAPVLQAQVAELARRGVAAIAINGGDGTVSHVLTAIAAVYRHEALPLIAILPSGNSNLIAADLGFGRRGVAALDALARVGAHARIEARAPLQIGWPDTARPSVLGFLCGGAAFSRAIAIAHSPGVLKYAVHDAAVVVTFVQSFGRLLFSRSARAAWLAGDALSVSHQGAPPRATHSFLFLATALRRFTYGVWPFWTGAAEAPDGVLFVNMHAWPGRLARALVSLLRGRAPDWLRRHPDYQSGRSQALMIDMPKAFVLDGEVFDTGPHGRFSIVPGPVFSFLRDPGAQGAPDRAVDTLRPRHDEAAFSRSDVAFDGGLS